MRAFLRLLIILIISLTPIVGSIEAKASDVFGITIEQRALDILTLVSAKMADVRGAAELDQVISMKAKIIVSDVTQPDDILQQIPQMIFWSRIEILKSQVEGECPYQVRVNLTSSFGELQFLVSECGKEQISLAILPKENVYTKIDIPQILPDRIKLPQDDGGLFTMLNLLGGIPFGSLLRPPSADGQPAVPDVSFVEELGPSELHAVVRYRGKDETPAGTVHVITVMTAGAAKNMQSMKIWVLEDTLTFYQISIEDERGTEVFITFDKIDMNPAIPAETFKLTDSAKEVSKEEFLGKFLWKVLTAPAIEAPMALDIYAASNLVARTGVVTISTDGFDMHDKENELKCQVEYKSPKGAWTPLSTVEYAGLPPMGHWNAVFAPNEAAELGMYSLRARYIDKSGNTSEWLPAQDMVKVVPTPPRVVRTIPVKFDTEVSISTNISITFSKPMDKDAVEKNFALTSDSGKSIKGLFTWDNNTLTFTPSGDLEYGSTHIVRITGESKDTEGIGLDGNYDVVSDGMPYDDYIWTFTTSAAPPALEFTTPDKPVYAGDTFDVRIMTKNMIGMYKFSLKVVFDPKILMVEKIDRASFLLWRPRPKSIKKPDLWRETVIDKPAGVITIACDGTRTDGVTGTGYIATISFKGLAAGKTSLEFREVSLFDSKGKQINAGLRTSEIKVIDFHPKDTNHDGVVDILDFAAAEEGKSQAAPPYVAQFKLCQNYPNPFNPETWIPYQLAQPSHVIVTIYSSTSQIVRSLDLGNKDAGYYKDKMNAAYWDGTDHTGQKVSSGVYFYTIRADGFTATKKMLLRK